MNGFVTKTVEFDAGHRLPNHKSKCRNVHGHRYKVEVTFVDRILDQPGESQDGMVVDFGDLTDLLNSVVYGPFDHGFIAWDQDQQLISFLSDDLGVKVITMPFPPTAENMARIIAWRLGIALQESSCEVLKVDVWETPTSRATVLWNDVREDYAQTAAEAARDN